MISLHLKTVLKSKKYLNDFNIFEYDSLPTLIFELFTNYSHGQKEIIEIETLLSEIGYGNLKEIPKGELNSIKKLVAAKLQVWESNEEAELLTYKLLAAVQSKEIIVYLDNNIIHDLGTEIKLTHQSIIAFISNLKLNAFSFSTI